MRNYKPIVITVFVIIMLAPIGLESEQVIAAFPPELYHGESFKWNVNNASTEINSWWQFFGPPTFVANWTVSPNSEATFSVINDTEVLGTRYLFGTFSIGNITLQTHDNDIGSALALSGFPWVGGLVYLGDWQATKTIAPFNESIADVSFGETLQILGVKTDVVIATYEAYGQTTELTYQAATGILLKGKTTFGSYWLELTLEESTIPVPETTQNLSAPPVIWMIGSGIIISLLLLKFKRKN